MIVLCAWCVKADRPAFLREQPPYRDPSISHGICRAHEQEWRAQLAAHVAARTARQSGGS